MCVYTDAEDGHFKFSFLKSDQEIQPMRCYQGLSS